MSHTSLHSDKLMDLILQKTNCFFQMFSITFYIFHSHSETKQIQLTLNVYIKISIYTHIHADIKLIQNGSESLQLFAQCRFHFKILKSPINSKPFYKSFPKSQFASRLQTHRCPLILLHLFKLINK